MPQRVILLGVPIDPITATQAMERMETMLAKPHLHHVITPNAEMLVQAYGHPPFYGLLQRSDLNLPDSIGLVKMARRTGQSLPERVTGADTVTNLCASLTSDHPVFLLGAAPGVAELAAEALRKLNPQLTIVGTYSGSPKKEEADAIIDRINAAAPHILFVAFGAPTQDLWIDQYRDRLKTVRIAMGVGGTFDFLAGKQKRAPTLFQTLGLEWLWRLVQQPSRITRIWRAVVVFPWLVWRHQK